MKLGIMQPYFFPYIGYWQLLNAVDTYVIYDDVNFIKSGWINRNRVLYNGVPGYFNLPLSGASSFKKINEVEVNINSPVITKNIKTLYNNYAKTPQFENVIPVVEKILCYKNKNLGDYLSFSLQEISSYLGITTKIIKSSNLDKDNFLKGQEKVVHICKLLGAREYYNAIGGTELYDVERFAKDNIRLRFLQTQDITYQQFNNKFQANLSIIDVMMFNSVEEIQKMLKQYELK